MVGDLVLFCRSFGSSGRCAFLVVDDFSEFVHADVRDVAAGDWPFVVASMTTAVAKRRNAAGLGTIFTTSVRRLISGEDRFHRGHDRWDLFRGDFAVQVAHKMHAAPLPRRTGELLADSSFQSCMGI
jgi:hypothetical protein